jgi:hypothetical protein
MDFKITKLDCIENKIITHIHWSASVTDGDIEESMEGCVSLDSNDPNNSSFIEYENLTKEQVVAWMERFVKVADIEETLWHNLNVKKNPNPKPEWVDGYPLPWK